MLVFSDFECPACKGFHQSVLPKISSTTKSRLNIVYLSYPLSYHKSALPAAGVAECLHKQGNLTKWGDLIFDKQDSLGVKSWSSFAQEAGFADTTGITECANNPRSIAKVEAAKKLVERFGVLGTPTIISNGWLFPNVPSASRIDSAVAEYGPSK